MRLTLNARAEQRAEWIRFDGPQGSSLSPEEPLDFVAAHSALVDAIEAGALLEVDDLLRAATLGGSIGPTVVIRALVAALEPEHPAPAGTRGSSLDQRCGVSAGVAFNGLFTIGGRFLGVSATRVVARVFQRGWRRTRSCGGGC